MRLSMQTEYVLQSEAGEKVGSVAVVPLVNRSLVHTLWVHPDWRGQGLARTLLGNVVADADKNGIVLESHPWGLQDVDAEKADRALYSRKGSVPTLHRQHIEALHRDMGFAPAEEREGFVRWLRQPGLDGLPAVHAAEGLTDTAAVASPIKSYLPWADLTGLAPDQQAFQRTHPVVRNQVLHWMKSMGQHDAFNRLIGVHRAQSQVDRLRAGQGRRSPYVHPSMSQPYLNPMDTTMRMQAVGAAVPVNRDDDDEHLRQVFGVDPMYGQLGGPTETHPKSRWQVEVGEHRRLVIPKEGEIPAELAVDDHGDLSTLFPTRDVRREPISHVYRAMSASEVNQAIKEGFIQSDQRGTIADWEGTNAGLSPATARSYVSHSEPSVIAKIRVHPEDGWFAVPHDEYVRTRRPIPIDRIEALSKAYHYAPDPDSRHGRQMLMREASRPVDSKPIYDAEMAGPSGKLDKLMGVMTHVDPDPHLSDLYNDRRWEKDHERLVEGRHGFPGGYQAEVDDDGRVAYHRGGFWTNQQGQKVPVAHVIKPVLAANPEKMTPLDPAQEVQYFAVSSIPGDEGELHRTLIEAVGRPNSLAQRWDHPGRGFSPRPMPESGRFRPGRTAVGAAPELAIKQYEGTEGNNNHITRNETGMIPLDWVRNMHGLRGEVPGEHRNAEGSEWDEFKNHVAAGTPGYSDPIFIMVEHGGQPAIAEGNHRRDAYAELGHTHLPAEIRYFGHAEREGTVGERAGMPRTAAAPRLTWDEIGERHPDVYGDPEVHGEDVRGDGEGIGWAAAHLAFNRPGHEEPDEGSYDLDFHLQDVPVHQIDYARAGMDDPRVASARRWYQESPDEVVPPVLVHRHGVYQVADGHHRSEAAGYWGLPTIPAYVAQSPHEDEPFSDGARAPYHGAKMSHTAAVGRTTVYHLTDNPRFKLDETFAPEDNSLSINPRDGRRGLYVGQPERWAGPPYNYKRPYVAELSVPTGTKETGRWGGENFIPADSFGDVRVERVMPYDHYIRREYKEPGETEEHTDKTYDTGELLRHTPARWQARYPEGFDVEKQIDTRDPRQWSDQQHADYLAKRRDYLHDVHHWGWNEFDDQHGWRTPEDSDFDGDGEFVRRDRNGQVMNMERRAAVDVETANGMWKEANALTTPYEEVLKKVALRPKTAAPDESGLKAAGIAVIAMDTGRVLMQQRALNPMMCPCGQGVTWDESNGYQHDDGSVSHDNDEFYGQSVSDLLDQGHPEQDEDGDDESDETGFDKTAALEHDPNEGTWEFPGGKLDPGESPRAAAAREFREEVGQDLPPGVFVGAWVSPGGITVTAVAYDEPPPASHRGEFASRGWKPDLGRNSWYWNDEQTGSRHSAEYEDGKYYLTSSAPKDWTLPASWGKYSPENQEELEDENRYRESEHDTPAEVDTRARQNVAAWADLGEGAVKGKVFEPSVDSWHGPRSVSPYHPEPEHHPMKRLNMVQPGDQSYGFQDLSGHTAPSDRSYAAPLHDVESMMQGFYDGHASDYSHGNDGDAESISKILASHNQPDKKIRIYRAVPHGISKIYGRQELTQMFPSHDPDNLAEWVGISKDYAQEHARSNKCPGCGGPLQVISGVAKAKDLLNEGYPTEWGYVGDKTLEHTGSNRIYKTKCPTPRRVPKTNEQLEAEYDVVKHQGQEAVEQWEKENEADRMLRLRPRRRRQSMVVEADYQSSPGQEDLDWLNNHGKYMGWEQDHGFGDPNFWARRMPSGISHFMIWRPLEGKWSGDVVGPDDWSMLKKDLVFDSAQAAHHGLNIAQDVGTAQEKQQAHREQGTPESFQGYTPEHTVEHVVTPHGIKHDLFQRLNAAQDDRWQQEDHGPYAEALIQLDPSLKFGTAGDTELGNGDASEGWIPRHHFAHDDTHFYDSRGRHPLGDLDYDYDHVELNGNPKDWEEEHWPAGLEEAKQHALAHGVLTRHKVSPELGEKSRKPGSMVDFFVSPFEVRQDLMQRHNAAKAPVYKGFIYLIQSEKDIDLGNREIHNPDDPDGDMSEQSAWWDIEHARKNPALRPEVKKGTPWAELELWADKSVRTNREVTAMVAKLASVSDEYGYLFDNGDEEEEEPQEYEQGELFPLHEPHHYYHPVSGRPDSPDAQALFDSQKAKTEAEVANFKQMYQNSPDAAPNDMIRDKQLKLLGPEWNYVRGKGGFVRSAYKNVDGASHHVTVVDPIWRGGPNNHEAVYHHQMLYPTGETARKYIGDIDHVFNAVGGQHRSPDDSDQWPVSGGGRWGQPRTRAPFNTDDDSFGREARANRRTDLLENDKFDPEQHVSFPDAEGWDNRRGPQWNVLHDSLNPPAGTDGPKGFKAGSISGRVLPNGDYEWSHYRLPIARATKDANGNRSIVVASEGRDWSGSGGWGPSTRSVTHDVYSQLKSQGHHVKWDDDVLPSTADDKELGRAGFQLSGGDYIRTAEGRRGNIVHHRIIPLGGQAGGQYQVQTYVNGIPKRVRRPKKNAWTPADPITSAHEAIKESNKRHRKYGAADPFETALAGDESKLPREPRLPSTEERVKPGEPAKGESWWMYEHGNSKEASSPKPMQKLYQVAREQIAAAKPGFSIRKLKEVDPAHHDMIMANNRPSYYEENNADPDDPKVYALKRGAGHATFLAPLVHNQTGQTGWIRGGTDQDPKQWKIYHNDEIDDAVLGRMPARLVRSRSNDRVVKPGDPSGIAKDRTKRYGPGGDQRYDRPWARGNPLPGDAVETGKALGLDAPWAEGDVPLDEEGHQIVEPRRDFVAEPEGTHPWDFDWEKPGYHPVLQPQAEDEWWKYSRRS